MMNNAPQVLDFLLGNINAGSKSTIPAETGVGNDLFAQLFGEQLALTDGLRSGVEDVPGSNDLIAQGMKNFDFGLPSAIKETGVKLPYLNGSGSAVTGLPLTPAAAQLALTETIDNNVELAPGKYEIKGVEIIEGQVELTLSEKGGNDNQPLIKLSLSAELVSKMFRTMSAANGQSNRVALDGVNEQISHLKSVLAEFDLKELRVELDDNTDIKKINEFKSVVSSTKITLVAEASGQAQSLRAKLNRSDYSARKVNRQAAAEPVLSNATSIKAGLMNLGRPNLIAGQTEQMFNNFLNISGDSKFASEEFITEDTETDFAGLKISSSTESNLESKPTVLNRPAQLILFKDSFMNLRPNGQSITLKIDPEHLGTARLRLVLRDNELIVRVVVDSMQAKALMERNLDRLVDQLSKADINVESIEVNVGGEDTNQSGFDQMAFWKHRNQVAVNQAGRESSAGKVEPVSIGYQPPAGYINRDGVNLLA